MVVTTTDQSQVPQRSEQAAPNAGISRVTLLRPQRPSSLAPPALETAQRYPRVAILLGRTPPQTLKAVRVVRIGAVGDLVAIEDPIGVVVGIERAGLVDVVLIAIRSAVVVRIDIIRISAQLDLDRILEPVSVRVQRVGWCRRLCLDDLVSRSRGFNFGNRRFLGNDGSFRGRRVLLQVGSLWRLALANRTQRRGAPWPLDLARRRGVPIDVRVD